MHQLVKLTDAIWLLQLAISSPLIHALCDPSQAPTGCIKSDNLYFRLILVNYMSKTGSDCPLVAGMTVSVAFDVFESSKNLELPINTIFFNRFLTHNLVSSVKR